ncbi:hypothetical protein C6502_17260 [Candidatus Poribacteria bacterium]|nr:MAG: hypothetical protein C6502_17260 [Candidatus Poribacteria bacterium]
MEEAKIKFFANHGDWDLPDKRKEQSESIQIIADGPKLNTSLIIYDDGEGQHPEKFERTFLSLLEGNKTEIHFVQGKYNMGGSGAIVFCGKKRYQLIGSKKYDNTGKFGFTLIREHPLSKEEENTKKNTWYEYLKVNGEIPAFHAEQQHLGLYNRGFKTGTIIKLYSYDLPAGIRSVISRDLNQSINEYLFEPVLPIITVDKKERYPRDRGLERALYGLKRRLEQDDSRYVETYFSDDFDNASFGKMKVACYVFKTKMEDRSVKETKETIRSEFFKNNMSVLFSVNGQVHGHYTSEFITRSLKLNLLKEHLLIHVDCTNMKYNFRKELFMASRDRLKDGEETRYLRQFLAEKLGDKNGRLAEIQKRRKESIAVESEDAKDLLKSLAQNLPMDSDLMKLLSQTLQLNQQTNGNPQKKKRPKTKKKRNDMQPFNPQRFPSFFKRRVQGSAEKAVTIPIDSEKTIYFDTDVEDHYFDRIEEPGELKIALLDFRTNETKDGNALGQIDQIENVFNVRKSSPQEGTIKLHLDPKEASNVGDAAKIKASLSDPSGEFHSENFWVKIGNPKAPQQPSTKTEEAEIPDLGLPEFILIHQEQRNNGVTWKQVEDAIFKTINHSTVMYPMIDGEKLEKIYINMDSTVFMNFKPKNPNEEQLELANRKYIASVYFHTLFLYTITKNLKYTFMQQTDTSNSEVELDDYLKDLFESHYAEFILNFGIDEFMQSLED